MPPRHLPDFLTHGDGGATYPRPTPEARLRSMIGTALPDLPPPVITHLAANVEEIDKLRKVALAADSLMDAFHEFDGNPSYIGEHAQALDNALEAIGKDRLSRIKYGG